MSFIEYLYNLESGCVCIHPNYNNKIKNRELFADTLTGELKNILQTHGKGDTKFIILVDLTKVNMNCEHATGNLFFYKKLKNRLEYEFPNKLEKIIIYDYTDKTIFLVTILKLILDKELRNKIIIDRNYKSYVDPRITSNITLNNNGSHY